MDNPLQYLRAVQAHDLPPNQQSCDVCKTPWGSHQSLEYPVILPCSCVAGSMCLELSFQRSPRCPLCHSTIRMVPGINAAPNPQRTGGLDQLRHLELRSGIINWPIPSIENTRPDRDGMRKVAKRRSRMRVRNGVLEWSAPLVENTVPAEGDAIERAEASTEELWSKLDALNTIHHTFLSVRDLQICIGLVDWRLGTTTLTIDVLNTFFTFGLFDWDERERRWKDLDAYMAGKSSSSSSATSVGNSNGRTNGADLRDVLLLINMRAGTSLSLNELELVLSWVNRIHRRDVALPDILGLGLGLMRNGGQQRRGDPEEGSRRGAVDDDGEFVRAFGTLDIRVGAKNAVEDLGDVFAQAGL